MNHSKQLPSRGVYTLILVLLTGCLPFPHTTLRSPEVRGRVLDARTQLPIESAKVFLTEHPQISCTTGHAGCFLLKATYNFHPGAIPPEGDWPARKYWEDKVTISHPNYMPLRIDHWPFGKGDDKGDILLEPKG
jgi:hypothetical protein